MKGLVIFLSLIIFGLTKAQEVMDRSSVIMPIFPGCESMQSNEKQQQCFSEKFTAAINQKLDKKTLDKIFEKSKVSKVMIMFQYTIGDDGKIGELKLMNAKNGGNEYELFKKVRTVIGQINKEYDIQPAKVGENTGRVVLTENFIYTVD